MEMNQQLRADADAIVRDAIRAVQPDAAVRRALAQADFPGRVVMVAIGKAAWQMAHTAAECLGDRLTRGVVCTKYGHSKGAIPRVDCYEGGHPVPDENGFAGTQAALALTADLTAEDTVLLLVSGGGSALFEKPLVSAETLRDITNRLLTGGAEITEINTIRKRLSAVKAGRFAQHCAPAHVFQIILSDILGDPLDMIASGPACPDSATAAEALAIARKYALPLEDAARALLKQETPKALSNVSTCVTGSVRELCRAAETACAALGYTPIVLTDWLCCEAREEERFFFSFALTLKCDGQRLAYIAGGETVVHLTGHGLGGRNQELALAACEGLSGLCNAAVFSVGSDGTDGPTDAAGGYVDGDTAEALRKAGIRLDDALRENDAYHALLSVGGLIVTGPTSTNVNDVSVALIDRE